MFDQLTDDRIIWRPYSDERVIARAPDGLSILCTRDYVYWYTRSDLVHDVFVEEYQVQRVEVVGASLGLMSSSHGHAPAPAAPRGLGPALADRTGA